jgi:hypothetical protein
MFIRKGEQAMNMPNVNKCEVAECAYNKDHRCHALAITVGDEKGAMCDTYWSRSKSSTDGGDPMRVGQVGACHMSDCEYNERLECSARGVTIGPEGDAADCLTYERA